MRSPSTPPAPTDPTPTAPVPPTAATARKDRQKAALKANMARRKAQAQALLQARTALDAAGETRDED
ncbi:MAG: hypothetical protein B7Z31_03445 [Rhodobacterales bacterium 12-65-15]|nr:MAG: hypothetical protein B7Z31_03445 [Rhodobacterales bacterium 12-65-15]